MPDRNLIIVIKPNLLDHQDFVEIGERMLAKKKNIHIHIHSHLEDIGNLRSVDWNLPTFTVSLTPDVKSPPRRGVIFFNRRIEKYLQIETMKKAGIPVPMTEIYERERHYHPDKWGDFVIVKSRSLIGSSKGKTAHLTPTRFLNDPEHFDDTVKSILLSDQALIQEFIPTGPNPLDHRATTFLGRVLYLLQGNSTATLPELNPNSPRTHVYDSKLKDPDNGIIRQRRLVKDQEILALAERVGKAFPGIPLLGVDILRHSVTGKLYVLETNAGGNTWHFSSPTVAEGRKFVSREDRINQFGAWDIAAQVLIEKTLYYAR